jgi:superfamily I DNA/RNA helicase
MRIANRSSASDDGAARFDSQLKRMLRTARAAVRDPAFQTAEPTAWRQLVKDFLQLVTRPVLTALSPGYQQGKRLDNLIKQAFDAFSRELAVDGDPVQALRRLSEVDAIRFLTIHKCKGLEFEKVVVLGVEHQLFWSDHETNMSEFFVAISRPKLHLILTYAQHRDRPEGASWRWEVQRTPHTGLLAFAHED